MKHLVRGTAFAAATALSSAAASAQALAPQTFPYKSGPVTITSCSLNENKSNSTVTGNSLRINYFPNVPGRNLTSITFRVNYAGTPVTVTDSGSFAYQAPITHQFDQLGGHAWAGPTPSVCRVLTATFDNGEVVNPPYERPGGTSAMMPAADTGANAPEAPPPGLPPASAQPPAPNPMPS